LIRRSPKAYWITAVLVTGALLLAVPLLPGARISAVWGVRVIEAGALGQLAAAAAAALATRPRRRRGDLAVVAEQIGTR